MAVERTKLFDSIANGAAWDAGVVFNRTNAIPIDKFSVFESLKEAQTYATSNPIAYPGQLIAVVPENGETTGYVILAEGNLARLATEADVAAVNAEVANVKDTINNLIPVFVGTLAQYNTEDAAGNIQLGTVVIITDDVEITGGEASGASSSVLGEGVLGYMILG